MTLTNSSKAQILSEKSALDSIDSSRNTAFRKGGLTWSQRVNMQTAWQRAHANDNYNARRTLNNSILSDQRNIDRWYLESPEYAAIVASEQAKADLIARNDNAALKLWNRINSQNIANEKAEKQRIAAVKEVQRVAAVKAENLRLELIQEKQDLELKNIQIAKNVEISRLQDIEDKEVDRVTKSIPLLTSILPVGIIGLLLVVGKKW
tara:strand:+ start:651 stop:1271 length:621 start_codon:yes stop_codon:yes gene_type:complete